MSKIKASKKIDELLSSSSEEEVPKKKTTKTKAKKVVESDESSEESVEFLKKKTERKGSNTKKANTKPAKKVESSSEDDSSSEEVVKKAPVKAAKKPVKKVESSSEDESSSEEVVKKAPAKKAPVKAESSDAEEEMEFKPQPKVEVPESTCTELFVKNLPWSADENKLYEFFGTYGTVNNVKVLYDRTTGKARGLAFIDFSSRAEAQKALDDQANLFIETRNLQISFSDNKPQAPTNGFQKPAYGGGQGEQQQGGFEKKWHDGEKFTAFVGNLGFKTSEASIGEFFGVCGNVLDVRIAKDQETGRSKGYAHVDFDASDAVTKAIAKAGENLDGRDVRVDTSTPRQGGGDRGGRGAPRGGRGGFGAPRGRGGFGGNPMDKAKKSGGIIAGGANTKVTFDDSD